jgi:hypothetical protein
MIPHRLPNDDMADNGMKDRVTACRKRLRENRVMSRTTADTELGELFPKTQVAGSHRSFSSRNATRSNVTFLHMEEEVGIT